MKVLYRGFWVLWMVLCFAVLTQGSARAGDCSGPDDCGAIPDNATKAAAGGGIVAGAGAAGRKKKKPEKDYGSGEATDEDSLFGK